MLLNGPVAQRLERLSHKELVSGSTPLRPIVDKKELEKFGELKEFFTFPDHLMERYAPPKTKLYGITDKRDTDWARYTRIDGIEYPSKKEGFYYDTIHYMIPIIKTNVAVGCLGFEFVNQNNDILVIQIQGSKNLQTKIKWDKLLLHTLCDWVFNETPVKRVRIVNSLHVPYWSPEREAQLHMRYDVLSRRMGFRPSTHQGLRSTVQANIQVAHGFYDYQMITSEMYFKKFP